MRCKYCDSDLPNRVPVCPFCGAPVEDFHSNAKWNEESDNSHNKESLNSKGTENTDNILDSKMMAAKIAGLDMRWYHLMIFAILFMMFAMYCGKGIVMILGMYNHSELRTTLTNQQLYANFPILRIVDVITGFIYVGVAGFTLITRKELAQFKKGGPMSLVILLVGMMCFPNARQIMLGFATHQIKAVRGIAFAPAFIQNLILLIMNHFYFQKRRFLFDE